MRPLHISCALAPCAAAQNLCTSPQMSGTTSAGACGRRAEQEFGIDPSLRIEYADGEAPVFFSGEATAMVKGGAW